MKQAILREIRKQSEDHADLTAPIKPIPKKRSRAKQRLRSFKVGIMTAFVGTGVHYGSHSYVTTQELLTARAIAKYEETKLAIGNYWGMAPIAPFVPDQEITPWQTILKNEANLHGINPCLARAIAGQESSDGKNLLSPDGKDWGIMGVNVKSAKDYCQIEDPNLLLHHGTNIRCGMKILHSKLDQFGWDLNGIRRYNGYADTKWNKDYAPSIVRRMLQCQG